MTLKSKAVKSVLWEEGRGVCVAWLLKWFRPVNLWCECAKSMSQLAIGAGRHTIQSKGKKQELKISPSCWLFSCPYRENTWSIEYATTQCVRYAIRKNYKMCKAQNPTRHTHTVDLFTLSVIQSPKMPCSVLLWVWSSEVQVSRVFHFAVFRNIHWAWYHQTWYHVLKPDPVHCLKRYFFVTLFWLLFLL